MKQCTKCGKEWEHDFHGEHRWLTKYRRFKYLSPYLYESCLLLYRTTDHKTVVCLIFATYLSTVLLKADVVHFKYILKSTRKVFHSGSGWIIISLCIRYCIQLLIAVSPCTPTQPTAYVNGRLMSYVLCNSF